MFLVPKRDPFLKEKLFSLELQKTFCEVKDRLVLQKGHCLFSAAALTSASPSSSQSLIFAFSDRSDPNSLQGPKSYISYLQNPSRLITTNFCISPIPWLLLTPLHALPPVQCYLYINLNNLIIVDFKNLPPSSLLKRAFLSISILEDSSPF